MQKADIGMIGLAVMGENLALNLEEKGFTVALWNRETEWIDRFLEGKGAGKKFIGCRTLEALADSLKKPRKIFMMIRAGAAVDEMIDHLLPLLDAGDIIIDGGNSSYRDSMRRCARLEERGLRFIGCGVSGGEMGARRGPSLMPGGSPEAWKPVQPLLQAIAAKVNGEPCCEWMGENGAGHFVKMMHNGIEYGDMQLICEAYHIMRDYMRMTNDEMSAVFREWNAGELSSYLIEITADILTKKDADSEALLDKILDTAGQKGTGKWTGIAALETGVPLTLIAEAVFSRCISARKDERTALAGLYPREIPAFTGDRAAFLDDLRQALYASRIISYTQGYELLRAAAQEYGWQLDYGAIARIWRGGCIIRSAFLSQISSIYAENPALPSLLHAKCFQRELLNCRNAWRRIAAAAISSGIPAPAMTAALSYFDGMTAARLPANLLQAQRDYFGAHTYERTDRPRGEFFHSDWTGEGGDTASTTYNI